MDGGSSCVCLHECAGRCLSSALVWVAATVGVPLVRWTRAFLISFFLACALDSCCGCANTGTREHWEQHNREGKAEGAVAE